jgi:hypothetical protein
MVRSKNGKMGMMIMIKEWHDNMTFFLPKRLCVRSQKCSEYARCDGNRFPAVVVNVGTI